MAVPRQVNAGRRTKFLVRNRTWTYGRPRNALIDKETGKVAKSGEKWRAPRIPGNGKSFLIFIQSS
ncbi:MAG: hypothetical protein WAL46_12120 [Nitrososphaeraceae archaeon]